MVLQSVSATEDVFPSPKRRSSGQQIIAARSMLSSSKANGMTGAPNGIASTVKPIEQR